MSVLRVALGVPFAKNLLDRTVVLEPRIQWLVDWDVLAPQRFSGDYVGDPAFRRTPEQQRRFADLLGRADAVLGIPDTDPSLLAAIVRRNHSLRWVHTMAAGGGSQVKAAGLTAAELGRVVFTTSAGVHGRPLAEFAAFGVLAGAKHLPRLLAQQRDRVWSDRWVLGQAAGGVALVLGHGGVGREVARTLKGLGMTVLAFARTAKQDLHVDEFVGADGLLAAAGRADAVVQTLPGTARTERLVGAEFFASLKPGATFVNVGRGSVVDESALIAAMRSDTISFALLDVVAEEPLDVESPLWELPNVVLSPHTAALTVTEEFGIVELFAENATRLLDGEALRNRVDTVEFY